MYNSTLNAPPDQSQIRDNLFPLPPMSYIKKYTDSAVTNGTAPTPPPLPIPNQICTLFGEQYNNNDHIITPLESQGIRQLYPPIYDSKKEMKKINISIVANFLDLLQIVSQEPSSAKRAEKLEHINILFFNMHHLINEYRPHQARDTLREIMKAQIESVHQTKNKALDYKYKSNDLLANLKNELNNYKQNSKPVCSIISECEDLSALLVENEIDNKDIVLGNKRKLIDDEMSCDEPPLKIKKEEEAGRMTFDNPILSNRVKDSDLWKQFFDEVI